ncbi:SHOCT domain-containing protein [Microbacterium sp. BLY]|uniref:SHOCT domain-containing protein n=1 Tax=Microbacterium sp. BLY TaxID=2823280 RepID=UPI001B31F54C|nr:SHOCT domain-containing protein [Microbacterium sp. BLY]MBP3978060.1 SHOCT domain-containing protein [Microbacterium sp. BLY]
MPMGRFGRPGLIGLAVRTAVVAGTASAVQGASMRHQQRRAQNEYEQQQYEAAQQQAQMAMAAPQTPVTASAPEDDMVAQLQQLAALRSSGVLTEEEFAAAKQKLLG